MESISPTIISSKPAERHLDKIRAEHSTLLDSMATQAARVKQFNLQRDSERMQKSQMDSEMNQKMMERSDNNQKASMDMAMKTKELELKRMALTQP